MSRARPLARSARCITLSSWWTAAARAIPTGASIPQLQQLFLDEGAEFAFNLDGGGSTTLYFRGEVINHALRRQGTLGERYHHVYQLRSHLL
ncbi:MAG: phosphodiester glycosidase family protein [Christensenellales bacterium]